MKLAHLFISIITLGLFLTLPCPSLAATADFTLSPTQVTTKPGESFNLNLQVSTGSTKLDALEIKLQFDPKKVELTQFQPTNTFNAEVRKKIDNQTGNLLWTTTDITKPRKIISGEVNLGTLTFKTKEAGVSAISFQSAQVGSIDTTNISSNKNQVQVEVQGEMGLLQRILSFFSNLFKR